MCRTEELSAQEISIIAVMKPSSAYDEVYLDLGVPHRADTGPSKASLDDTAPRAATDTTTTTDGAAATAATTTTTNAPRTPDNSHLCHDTDAPGAEQQQQPAVGAAAAAGVPLHACIVSADCSGCDLVDGSDVEDDDDVVASETDDDDDSDSIALPAAAAARANSSTVASTVTIATGSSGPASTTLAAELAAAAMATGGGSGSSVLLPTLSSLSAIDPSARLQGLRRGSLR